ALRGDVLDQLRASGELTDRCPRHPGDLEIVARPVERVAEFLQPVRQPHPERGLPVWGVPLQVAELPGLPPPLRPVEGRVEVVADRPTVLDPRRQPLARRVAILAEEVELPLADGPLQAEPPGTKTAPIADEFLALAVIVGRRVVGLRGCGTGLLGDPEHARF